MAAPDTFGCFEQVGRTVFRVQGLVAIREKKCSKILKKTC